MGGGLAVVGPLLFRHDHPPPPPIGSEWVVWLSSGLAETWGLNEQERSRCVDMGIEVAFIPSLIFMDSGEPEL